MFLIKWIEFLVSIYLGCVLCVCVVSVCVCVCTLGSVCVYVCVLVSIWMHIPQHTCGQPQISIFAFLCWLLHIPDELASCFWAFSYQHLPSEISITGITYSPYNTQPSVASEDAHLCSKVLLPESLLCMTFKKFSPVSTVFLGYSCENWKPLFRKYPFNY